MFENYINETRAYLKDLPAEERDEILQFYAESFLDQELTEEQVIQKYGTPKQFSRMLRLESAINADDAEMADTSAGKEKTPMERGNIVWLVLLTLFASPVLIFLAIGVLGIIFTFLISMISLIVTTYVMIVSGLAAGLGAIVAGIGLMSQNAATAFTFVGIGLILTGFAVIFFPVIWNFTKWAANSFVELMKWIGRKLVARNAA